MEARSSLALFVVCVGGASCGFDPAGEKNDTSEDARAVDASVDADPAACPSNYVELMGGRYRYVATPATWEDALADCADDLDGAGALHTHLVVLATDEERSQLRTTYEEGFVWIGLSDRVSTFDWLWVTAEAIGTYPPPSGPPWKSGQPTNGDGGRQDCVVMETSGLWDDRVCDDGTYAYVCECDAHVQEPTRF
jgi:hypothetical protein